MKERRGGGQGKSRDRNGRGKGKGERSNRRTDFLLDTDPEWVGIAGCCVVSGGPADYGIDVLVDRGMFDENGLVFQRGGENGDFLHRFPHGAADNGIAAHGRLPEKKQQGWHKRSGISS